MQTKDIFIAHPTTKDQINVLKAVVKAFKIEFEITKEIPYNPDFVAKIQKSRQQFKEGKFTRVNKENLENLLGI